VVVLYIRKFRGLSHPVLVEASDGKLYVLKFNENPEGPNVPFNEAVGIELYRACGLPTPRWRLLQVDDWFLDRSPECWPKRNNEPIRPASGLSFACRFLGEEGRAVYDLLPRLFYPWLRNREGLWLAWLVDACAGGAQWRKSVYIEDERRGFHAVFIDHGHLLGGPEGNKKEDLSACCHYGWEMYPDAWPGRSRDIREAVTSLNRASLWRRVESFPKAWMRESALLNFARCLERLGDIDFMEESADRILSAHAERVGKAKSHGTRFPRGLLRDRVQPHALEQAPGVSGASPLTCSRGSRRA
jgi:hypothetical protein